MTFYSFVYGIGKDPQSVFIGSQIVSEKPCNDDPVEIHIADPSAANSTPIGDPSWFGAAITAPAIGFAGWPSIIFK